MPEKAPKETVILHCYRVAVVAQNNLDELIDRIGRETFISYNSDAVHPQMPIQELLEKRDLACGGL